MNTLINNRLIFTMLKCFASTKISLKVFLMSFLTIDSSCTVSAEDPKAYMKQFLEKLKDARTVQRNYPCIFDDSNVRSLFGMLDVTGKGFITYEQYKQGDLPYIYYSFTVSLFNSLMKILLKQFPLY